MVAMAGITILNCNYTIPNPKEQKEAILAERSQIIELFQRKGAWMPCYYFTQTEVDVEFIDENGGGSEAKEQGSTRTDVQLMID